MKRILVATDGSEAADRAVEYAARLAKGKDADLIIVNVVGGYGLPDSLFSRFTNAEQAWLKELLESLSAELLTKARERARSVGAGTIQIESRAGPVAVAIMDVAREKQADVIIVGKRGAGPIARLLIGSVSQKLVNLSTLPVIVIP